MVARWDFNINVAGSSPESRSCLRSALGKAETGSSSRIYIYCLRSGCMVCWGDINHNLHILKLYSSLQLAFISFLSYVYFLFLPMYSYTYFYIAVSAIYGHRTVVARWAFNLNVAGSSPESRSCLRSALARQKLVAAAAYIFIIQEHYVYVSLPIW